MEIPKEGRWAPYTTPPSVLRVIHHYRERDVPEYVTGKDLLQIGVPEGLVNRTVAALEFLGLTGEDGLTTQAFRALRFASSEEYGQVLGGIIDKAYADIFAHVEITTATDQQIRNAFIPYAPGAQRSRMIALFLALCQEAGYSMAVSVKQRAASDGQKPARLGKSTRQRQHDPTPPPPATPAAQVRPVKDPTLDTWYARLPEPGQPFPSRDRDQWMKTFRAILDGVYGIETGSESEEVK